MASAITIEKLNATNYVSWSADMKFLLLERNAWDIVNGTEKLPEIKEGSSATPKDVKDFKTRENIALSLIYLFIQPEFRKIIEKCSDPVESWKKLHDHFYPDNRAQHMMLFTELSNCKMMSEEKIDMYAARLQRLYDRIVAIDPNFSSKYLIFQLLRYLPSKFDNIVQVLLRLPEAEFTMEKILPEMISEETRITLRELDITDGLPEVNTVVNKLNRKKNITCYSCNQRGHYSSECKEKRRHHPRRRSISPDLSDASKRKRGNKPGVRRHFKRTNYDRDSSSRADYLGKCSSQFLIQANVNESPENQLEWIFDTAATHHFCGNRDLFTNFIPLKGEEMAVAVQNEKFPIEGKGNVKLKFGQRFIRLNDVMYSPKLRRNLLSGPRFDKANATFCGEKGEVKVSDQCGLIFKGILRDGLYYVKPVIQSEIKKRVNFESSAANVNDINLWHKRLAHVNTEIIRQTCKSGSVSGLPKFKNTDFYCESCKLNKFKRVSFKHSNRVKSKRPLELIFADVWGPCKIEGRKGEKYFLSVIDDFSRRVALYPLKQKSQVPEILQRHIIRAERFLGKKVKAIRTDNGREFVNSNFDSFCDKLGIRHEHTNTYTPEQNGVAERYNQTVADGTRTILCESGLDASFWPEAMLYFTYTWNRMCHKNQSKTPFELYGGFKPSIRHLKPFGAIAYIGIPRQNRDKLEAKAKKGVLIGYAFKTKGYRLWIPESDSIVESINVSFNEDMFYKSLQQAQSSGAVLGTLNWFPYSQTENSDSDSDEIVEEKVCTERTTDESHESDSDVESTDEDVEATPTTKRHTTWIRKLVPRPDGSRIDVYYYEKDKSQRLRSIPDVMRYCKENNIHYEPNLFNFKQKYSFEGEVSSSPDPDANLSNF